MGNALSEQGKNKEGLTLLLKGLSLDSLNSSLYINIGFVYQALLNNDSAIMYFSKAIKINPNFPEAYSNRSYSYYQLGKNEDALTDINKSISLWNTNSYAYWIRAMIYIKQGKINEACTDLNTAEAYGYAKYYGSAVEKLKLQHCKK